MSVGYSSSALAQRAWSDWTMPANSNHFHFPTIVGLYAEKDSPHPQVLVALGLFAVVFRIVVPYANTDDLGFHIGWPVDTTERLFWIPIYICAGFFEELVYRGYAIPALRGKNVQTWLAVFITSAAFSLIPGAADWVISGLAFVLGIIFALTYLWRRNLALVMIIHALADWGFLLLP